MALAIGIAVHCEGCVAYHTKMAHQHGAAREEVVETVALAVYMGADRRRCTEAMPCGPMINLANKVTCSRLQSTTLSSVLIERPLYSFFSFASRAKRKALKRSIFFTAASRRASSCFNASLISASRLLLRSKTDSATTGVLV